VYVCNLLAQAFLCRRCLGKCEDSQSFEICRTPPRPFGSNADSAAKKKRRTFVPNIPNGAPALLLLLLGRPRHLLTTIPPAGAERQHQRRDRWTSPMKADRRPAGPASSG